MRTVEYRRWAPLASPLSVEFPADLLLELGWAESSGILYGWRRGRELRVTALRPLSGEELEKVGVFVSRIRGEVFLTESDLALMSQQPDGVALVVAANRGGFFVREPNGSIQTVRSHEEFSVAEPPSAPPTPMMSVEPRPMPNKTRRWAVAGLLTVSAIPLAALTVFSQRMTVAPRSLEIRDAGGQLRISWKPAQNAMLIIEDSGGRVAIPVYANQSTVTYAPSGAEVEVTLSSVDATNRLRRESARYVGRAKPEQ